MNYVEPNFAEYSAARGILDAAASKEPIKIAKAITNARSVMQEHDNPLDGYNEIRAIMSHLQSDYSDVYGNAGLMAFNAYFGKELGPVEPPVSDTVMPEIPVQYIPQIRKAR